MILYTSQTSPRLRYIVHFIENIIGEAIIITTDEEQFSKSSHGKINYSDNSICSQEYHIKTHGLLFETTIQNIEISISSCRNNLCFFIRRAS